MTATKQIALIAKLSKPAHRALAAAGIRTLQQLSKWTEKDFSALHGVGPKSVTELKLLLKDNGLNFAVKK